MDASPMAQAYFRFLKLSSSIAELPGLDGLDANHKALFEVIALHWWQGTPLTVRETIGQTALGSPATLHKRLKRLIALDFINSEGLATDRRTKFVSPTRKGLKYVHLHGAKLAQSMRPSAD